MVVILGEACGATCRPPDPSCTSRTDAGLPPALGIEVGGNCFDLHRAGRDVTLTVRKVRATSPNRAARLTIKVVSPALGFDSIEETRRILLSARAQDIPIRFSAPEDVNLFEVRLSADFDLGTVTKEVRHICD